MDDSKRKRKRILVSKKDALSVVDDPLEFKKNKSSDNARSITKVDEQLEIELWYDKHYLDRYQHGDEKGRREGIDTDTVETLVLQSVKHMLFYCAYVKNFTFLNHDGVDVDGRRAIRTVCQKEIDGELLNVVVEIHFKTLNSYEITVKTAMRTDDFKISDGQYVIEVIDEEASYLKKMIGGKLTDIYSI